MNQQQLFDHSGFSGFRTLDLQLQSVAAQLVTGQFYSIPRLMRLVGEQPDPALLGYLINSADSLDFPENGDGTDIFDGKAQRGWRGIRWFHALTAEVPAHSMAA